MPSSVSCSLDEPRRGYTRCSGKNVAQHQFDEKLCSFRNFGSISYVDRYEARENRRRIKCLGHIFFVPSNLFNYFYFFTVTLLFGLYHSCKFLRFLFLPLTARSVIRTRTFIINLRSFIDVHKRDIFITFSALTSRPTISWCLFATFSLTLRPAVSGSDSNRRFIIWPALGDVSWHASPRGTPVLCVDTGRSSFTRIAWESGGWYLNYLSRCFGPRWSVKTPIRERRG